MSTTPRVISNNQLANRQLTLAGCGLSLHVVPEIVNELADGRLVRVLPDWSLPKPQRRCADAAARPRSRPRSAPRSPS